MARTFGLKHREPPATCTASGQHPSLIEHEQPTDGPAYHLSPPAKWSPDRTRLWIALSHLLMQALALLGLFGLIVAGIQGAGLLVWQGVISALGMLNAAITAYYFPRRDEQTPSASRYLGTHLVAGREPSAGTPRRTLSVAIIGSFRHHYDEVCWVAGIFQTAGLRVTSPVISEIVNPGANFVRFAVDPSTTSDEELQELALGRILAAELVYVVAPGGYIGRTTCYELGQVLLRHVPVYFSSRIEDLPIDVPDHAVRAAADLAAELSRTGRVPVTA
jgi:hypothetical protein